MGKNNKQEEVGKGGAFKLERTAIGRGPQLQAPRLENLQGLPAVIQATVYSGAYISFGRTSDGAAILIRVLDGPDKLSTYCTTAEELQEALDALAGRYEDYMPSLPEPV